MIENAIKDTEVTAHITSKYSPQMAKTLIRLREESKAGSDRARLQLSDLLLFVTN